jgi:hypothetical protein
LVCRGHDYLQKTWKKQQKNPPGTNKQAHRIQYQYTKSFAFLYISNEQMELNMKSTISSEWALPKNEILRYKSNKVCTWLMRKAIELWWKKTNKKERNTEIDHVHG